MVPLRHVRVDNSAGVRSVTTDGQPAMGGTVTLRDHEREREVGVVLS